MMTSLCTQEAYNHSISLSLAFSYDYVCVYYILLMGQTEIEDSVHPATDVELLSHRYSFHAFVPFCLPSSLIRKSLRAANGGNCELVAHWNPRPTSLATVFFLFHLFFGFFAISSFCSRIPCHISIRYTCIKEPVDFRNKNT